jgi:hypothetical protein
MIKPLWLGIIGMAAVVAAGCVQRMEHPTKPSSQWAADHAECEREIRHFILDSSDRFDIQDEMTMIRKCMRDNGWRIKR